jgi:hypothetical protein
MPKYQKGQHVSGYIGGLTFGGPIIMVIQPNGQEPSYSVQSSVGFHHVFKESEIVIK